MNTPEHLSISQGRHAKGKATLGRALSLLLTLMLWGYICAVLNFLILYILNSKH